MTFDTLPHSRKARNCPRPSSIDAALQELLTELASIFLPRGVTPRQFGEFAKRAFVQAAANVSQFRTGRVNQSRVAVLTGMSRAQVRSLLGAGYHVKPRSRPSRIERIIHAWRTDSRFCNERGPKPLTIVGGRPSFSRLVKMHAGDVPHRAVLDELRRIGAVKTFGGTVTLAAPARYQDRRVIRDLSKALPVAIDGLRLMPREPQLQDGSSVLRITLHADDPLDLTRIRSRCTLSAEAMLKGLRESLGVQVTTPRSKGGDGHCTVTVLVAQSARLASRSRAVANSQRSATRKARPSRSIAPQTRRSK